MSNPILVAYDSGSGSTKEVAEAIGDVLGGAAPVDVRRAADVEALDQYGAVVLGSSIRLGRWLPGALAFLEQFADELASRPVAYFTTCLTMVDDSPESRQTVLAYLEPILQMAPDVHPVGLGLFAGSLNPSMQLLAPGSTGPYGDYRDWETIRAWAETIRPALLSGIVAPDGPVVLGEVVSDYGHGDAQEAPAGATGARQGQRASVREVDLSRADLGETDLSCADLQGADLERASLSWAALPGCDLSGCILRRSNLIGADLRDANLDGADLSFAVLNGAILRRASLSGATLLGADLNWAELDGATLEGADLTAASLAWASLRDVNLRQANLSKVRYNEHTIWPDGFSAEAAGCIFVGGER